MNRSFHDGSIIAIEHIGSKIRIAMQSAEISPKSTIKGVLSLSGVTRVEIDGKRFKDHLEMRADCATILDFDVNGPTVHFFIEWINYPNNNPGDEYTDIVIEADTISWQDDPLLFDPYALPVIEERFIIPLIILAVPSLKKHLADPLHSVYGALGDLAVYVAEKYQRGDLTELPRIFNLIERLHKDGDEFVKEAATIGFLESLQNRSSNAEEYVQFLGPESKRWWDILNDFWSRNR